MPTLRLSEADIAEFCRLAGVVDPGPARMPEMAPCSHREKHRRNGESEAKNVDSGAGDQRRPRGRTRHTPGQMNKTEAAYAQHLEERKRTGEIEDYWFEPWKFRLANRTYYSPDFVVMMPGGELEIHELKGWMEDDAAVKLKVTAAMYWLFPVRVIKRVKREWVSRTVAG